VLFLFLNATIFYTPMNSLPLEKSMKTGLYVKCIPLKGSGGCSSGEGNSKRNSSLSCYRRMICFVVVFHFDFSKVLFLIK
jgi:hypothetical protein